MSRGQASGLVQTYPEGNASFAPMEVMGSSDAGARVWHRESQQEGQAKGYRSLQYWQ